ncbi:hypothetical protein [Roseovarius aestuarii]|uniref:Uncharacterized protein n=1 Tax=Roseovarius aestuarii TaxID=475083 RepID=A0A1X7BWJ7_9RHOB|nr:hypothetical protein [Roseovarius aestuarii]SMC14006.1 hypothetical protein ROA7745_03868 [Roseovarius aestuarii]
MSTLAQIAEELAVFDSDDDTYVEPWAAEELEASEGELKQMGEEAFALALAAYISHNGRCGFANAGSIAFVVNRRRDRPVRATVRVRWRRGINYGSYDRVKTIPAGSRVRLGCTRSGSIPVTDYSYSVIGAQVL